MFNLEAVDPRDEKSERLKLALGSARDQKTAEKVWEDTSSFRLEKNLSDIFVTLLMEAEATCRKVLVERREWIIKRKADARTELLRRNEEEQRRERERKEKLARERVNRSLSQSRAFRRASEIRTNVDSILSYRSGETVDIEGLALWARNEADLIDPVKKGVFAASIAFTQKHPRSHSIAYIEKLSGYC